MTLRQVTALAALAATALIAVGCTAQVAPQPGASGSATPVTDTAPEGFEKYYQQKLDWKQCDADLITPTMMAAPSDLRPYQCATLQVPMNWDDADSEPIELGIARHLNDEGTDAPALFYNLGGPGGGAVDSLTAVIGNVLTKQLVDHFQVVALDPRGVGTSTPIWCMTDEERDQDIATEIDLSSMSTDEIVAQAEAEVGDLGQQCLERNGDVLGFVDTDSAARDFDVARVVLGQAKLDYLGFSYGTVLGATYAELFPGAVGHLVLDGAVDPSLSINELSAAQVEGMEKALYNWIEVCQQGSSCPLNGGLENGKDQMINFLDSIASEPLPTADVSRPLNSNLAYTAIIGSLYSADMYPLLTQAVSQGFKGDGTTLLFLADYFNSRSDSGEFTDNSSDAFMAINALDYEPVGTPDEWQAQFDQLSEQFPVLGPSFGFASAGMDAWPVQARVARHRITAPGTPEILVIGTTNDPATPYFMAENLANDLEGGVLLTVEGWDHTAYGKDAGACVVGAVDGFLINGKVPQDGLVCTP